MHSVINKYPYFIYPAVIQLQDDAEGKGAPLSEETRNSLRNLVAANVGDIPSLRLMLTLDPAEFADFYPDMHSSTPSTSETIDSFLDHFGNSKSISQSGDTPSYEIQEKPDLSISEDLSDNEEKQIADPTESAIDSFLSSYQRPATPPSSAKSLKRPLKSYSGTASEAKELIKKHDYEGALKIIQALSLNNPEKSIYFADQIRFLKKLIVNERHRLSKNNPKGN